MPALLRTASAATWRGTAVFIDIRGFSRLTLRLAQRENAGVEELTVLLRSTFSAVIDALEGGGGVPLQFLGDCVLAWFDEDAASTSLDRARAAVSSLLHSANDAGAFHRDITFRAGVGRGSLHIVTVRGTPAHHMFDGSAIRAAGSALEQAGSGAFEVSEVPAHESLARDVERSESVAAEALSAWVPAWIEARFVAGLALPDPEFRKLSIAFVAPPSETAHDQTPRALEVLREHTREWGGELHQCARDDKDAHGLVVFGGPGRSSENDEERAVRCLLALGSIDPFDGGSWAAGVSTGVCYVGLRGDQRLTDVAVIGPVVNLAAFMMHRLGPGIHCDAATRDAASGVEFAFDRVIVPKGAEEPISVFTPLSTGTMRRRARSEVVGRSGALATLQAFLTPTEDVRESRLAIVWGPAGIGKSAVLSELSSQLRAAGRPVVWALGSSFASRDPLLPWTRLIAQRFGSGAKRGELPPLEPELQPYAALLNDVLGVELAETEALAALSGEARTSKRLALVVSVVTRLLNGTSTILLLDDIHEFDVGSLTALAQILAGAPHLVIAALRGPSSVALSGALTSLFQTYAAMELDLEPLSDAAAAVLACSVLQCDSLSRSLAQFLRARAAGNPLYIRELCVALLTRNACRVVGGVAQLSWPTAREGEITPVTLHSLVATRVDGLEVRTRECLRFASVLGREFSALQLSRMVSGLTLEEVRASLNALVAEGLLAAAAYGEVELHSFAHELLRAAIYESIGPAARRNYHALVASHLLSDSGPLTFTVAAGLAYHYERSEEHVAATYYASTAADFAYHAAAHHLVISFYEAALRNRALARAAEIADVGRDAEKVWKLRLGLAYVAQRDYDAAAPPLEQSLAAHGHRLPGGTPAEVATALREVGQFALAELGAGAMRKPAPGEPPADPSPLLDAADAFEALGEVYYFTERPILCFVAVMVQLRLARAAGPSNQLAKAHANVAITAGLLPIHSLAERLFAHAFELARTADPAARGHVLLVRGMYRAGRAQWKAAIADLSEVAELAVREGLRRLELDALSNLAYVAFLTKHHGLAAELADHLVHVASHEPRLADEGRRIRAYCACAEGDHDTAWTEIHALEAMLKVKDTAAHLSTRVDLHAHRGLLHALEGRPDAALEDAEIALSMRERNTTGIGYYTDVVAMDAVARTIVELKARSGDSPSLRALEPRTKRVLRKMSGVYDFAHESRARFERRGDRPAAQADVSAGLSLFADAESWIARAAPRWLWAERARTKPAAVCESAHRAD